MIRRRLRCRDHRSYGGGVGCAAASEQCQHADRRPGEDRSSGEHGRRSVNTFGRYRRALRMGIAAPSGVERLPQSGDKAVHLVDCCAFQQPAHDGRGDDDTVGMLGHCNRLVRS